MKYKTSLNRLLFILAIILIFMSGCKTTSVKMQENSFSVSTILLFQNEELLYESNFLRFDFTIIPAGITVDASSLFHIKALFISNGNVVARTTASEAFLKKIGADGNHINYSAFLFKSLEVKLNKSQQRVPIRDLVYDEFTLVAVEPTMTFGDEYRSNIITYSKNKINYLISQGSKSSIKIKR